MYGPYMGSKGIVAFHDNPVIDGCREFILDPRRNNNGSYDVIDFPTYSMIENVE